MGTFSQQVVANHWAHRMARRVFFSAGFDAPFLAMRLCFAGSLAWFLASPTQLCD
jgi:hypothetical protein